MSISVSIALVAALAVVVARAVRRSKVTLYMPPLLAPTVLSLEPVGPPPPRAGCF